MLVFRKQIDNLKTNHRVRLGGLPSLLGTSYCALLFSVRGLVLTTGHIGSVRLDR